MCVCFVCLVSVRDDECTCSMRVYVRERGRRREREWGRERGSGEREGEMKREGRQQGEGEVPNKRKKLTFCVGHGCIDHGLPDINKRDPSERINRIFTEVRIEGIHTHTLLKLINPSHMCELSEDCDLFMCESEVVPGLLRHYTIL